MNGIGPFCTDLPVHINDRSDFREVHRNLRRQRIGDPGCLLCTAISSFNGCKLRQHHRLIRSNREHEVVAVLIPGHALTACQERVQASPCRILVIDIQAGPIHVVITGVDHGQVGVITIVPNLVGCPNPGDVGSTDRGEDVVHMPPGFDEVAGTVAVYDLAGGCFALAPWIPPAVHLVIEPHEKWMSPVLGSSCPACDVGIIVAVINIRKLEIGLIDACTKLL